MVRAAVLLLLNLVQIAERDSDTSVLQFVERDESFCRKFGHCLFYSAFTQAGEPGNERQKVYVGWLRHAAPRACSAMLRAVALVNR